jgi:hypothetical protein
MVEEGGKKKNVNHINTPLMMNNLSRSLFRISNLAKYFYEKALDGSNEDNTSIDKIKLDAKKNK